MYTPRSLADSTAIRVFPINETVKLTECLLIICLVPINMNFVFSGFINKSMLGVKVRTYESACYFLQHFEKKIFCTEINHGKSLAKGGSDREKLKKKMGHFFLTPGPITKKKNSPRDKSYQMGSFL